jgi:hypothetical protein
VVPAHFAESACKSPLTGGNLLVEFLEVLGDAVPRVRGRGVAGPVRALGDRHPPNSRPSGAMPGGSNRSNAEAGSRWSSSPTMATTSRPSHRPVLILTPGSGAQSTRRRAPGQGGVDQAALFRRPEPRGGRGGDGISHGDGAPARDLRTRVARRARRHESTGSRNSSAATRFPPPSCCYSWRQWRHLR